MEVLGRSPLVIADGAHNPYSIATLAKEIKFEFPTTRCILVVGFSRGHDFESMGHELSTLEPELVISTQSRNSRSIGTSEITNLMQSNGLKSISIGSVTKGMEKAISISEPNDLILITGSLFVVAEAREFLLNITPELYPGFDR